MRRITMILPKQENFWPLMRNCSSISLKSGIKINGLVQATVGTYHLAEKGQKLTVNKRLIWICIAALLLLLPIFSLGESFNRDVLEEEGLNIEEVHVSVSGLKNTYYFIWVSDLHIVIDNDEIADDQHDFVKSRQQSWAIRSDGKQAGDWWVESLAEVINSSHPDAILFGGDMLDLCSEATVNKFREGLTKITVPFMYIRADHDNKTHWLKNPEQAKNNELHDNLCDNDTILALEYPEFIILGINDSTYQMTPEAVNKAKDIANQGKPIIVVTHVPYDSIVDRSLDEISRAAWQDRNLTWGEGTSYVPNEKMQKWMDIVLRENSPVVEVLAGHLHLSWDGLLTKQVHEHVFSQAFSGYVGLITVDGE